MLQTDTSRERHLLQVARCDDADAALAFLHEASPTELQTVLQDGIWHATKVGEAESLDATALLRWLEIFLEGGDEFAARRIEDAGDDFIDSLLSQFCQVRSLELVSRNLVSWDDSDQEPEFDSNVGELNFAEHLVGVVGDDPDIWETIRRTLRVLSEEAPDFLMAALARAEEKPSPDGFEAHMHSAQPSEKGLRQDDLLHGHERFMGQRGFVTAFEARELLFAARRLKLSLLPVEENCAVASTEAALSVISNNSRDRYRRVRDAIQLQLVEDSQAGEALLQDVAYVGNVLMVGVSLRRKPLTEPLAADAALATIQLGLSWTLPDSSPIRDRQILVGRGVTQMFSIGWHILQCRVLPLAASALQRALLNTCRVKSCASHELWIRREILREVCNYPIGKRVKSMDWESLEDLLGIVDCVLDNETGRLFHLALCEIPRMKGNEHGLAAGDGGGVFFASMEDVLCFEREVL